MQKLILTFTLCYLINAMPFIFHTTIEKNKDYKNFNDDYDSNDYNVPCYEVQNYYTTGIIINNIIMYSKNITNATNIEEDDEFKLYNYQNDSINNAKNITFHGVVELNYKTLPYCSYNCDMLVIANQKNSEFITIYFSKYFRIGGTLNMLCNNTICTWGHLICEAKSIRDEL